MEAAAAVIHERGVAGATLDDVKAAAGVSGSRMYRSFPDKDELVQAVIDDQADAILNRNRQALSRANGGAPKQGGLPTWFARWSARRE